MPSECVLGKPSVPRRPDCSSTNPHPTGIKLKKQKTTSGGASVDTLASVSNGKEYVRVNSGFVIAYGINYALSAIRKTQSAVCAKPNDI
jgi:hypothetical protein